MTGRLNVSARRLTTPLAAASLARARVLLGKLGIASRARVLLHMRPDDPAQQIDAPRVGPIGQGRLIVRGIFQRDRQLSAVDSIGQCNTQRTA